MTFRTISADLRNPVPKKFLFHLAINFVGAILTSIVRFTAVVKAATLLCDPSASVKDMFLCINFTFLRSSIKYNLFTAMERDAPVSAHTAASTQQLLRTIKLDGDVGDTNVKKLTLFTDAFSSPLNLKKFGLLDCMYSEFHIHNIGWLSISVEDL
ncbi:hypothetical protein NPIL_276931 [Nephila pilipes]|uniref:Uncharacterized protein n=1 Tax=Nephila pilipes TaxID=299642 RepID=A0A8X6MV78_NEPPI|nr:hypothetical protein NPIL_276931 [Nephila pilipes]